MLFSQDKVTRLSVVLLVGVLIARAVLQAFVTISRQRLLIKFGDQLRISLLDQVLHAPAVRLQNVGRGEILGLMVEDIDRTTFALQKGTDAVQAALALIVYIGSVLAIGSKGSLPLLFGLAATGLAALFQRSDAVRLGELQTRLNDVLMRTVGDGLHGLKAVRAACAESWWMQRFVRDTEQAQRLVLEITQRQTIFSSLKDVLAVLVVGIWLVLFRSDLGQRDTVTTLLLTYRAAGAASAVIEARRMFLGQLPGYEQLCRIRKQLGQPPEPANPVLSQLSPRPSLLSIASVSVRSDSKRIGENSLELKSHALTGLVGASGSGKTTWLDSFSGLLVGEESQWVLRDNKGHSLVWGPRSVNEWRSLVSYAPQETLLFEGTLRENLLLGLDQLKPPATKEIETWLERLGLESLLQRPEGLDCDLQLSLDCFSGGEIRRLGLIRAWLMDRPIEVLDEPTASLDEGSADVVRTILRERASERTVLIACHDKELAALCDKVYNISEFFGHSIANHPMNVST
ncbi:ABC transporter ATP-binding protein/permease [Synechococcus sp. CS-1324]|uniref:ATP-binding cassette domain-containing protein n=1 Tax=Synechococcus sp. CS-1324 TaxID=2847980 RepID=UPI00223BD04D|nr:ABC transporter ATP-binding protein [Synechococcus sp. CS-1324]MCT0231179.1 ABC transporter ATP-binding protein/permease [Synechococcus sp. CS-1324]